MGDQGRCPSREEYLQKREEEDGYLLQAYGEVDVFQKFRSGPGRDRD